MFQWMSSAVKGHHASRDSATENNLHTSPGLPASNFTSGEVYDSSIEDDILSTDGSLSVSSSSAVSRVFMEDWEWVEDDDHVLEQGLMRALSEADDSSDIHESSSLVPIQVNSGSEGTGSSRSSTHRKNMILSGSGTHPRPSRKPRSAPTALRPKNRRSSHTSASNAPPLLQPASNSNSSSSLGDRSGPLHPALAAIRDRELKMRKLNKLSARPTSSKATKKTLMVY